MYESEVMEMKLKSEIPFIRESFNKITNLPEYAERLKANGNYKDFGTRLAFTVPSQAKSFVAGTTSTTATTTTSLLRLSPC